MKIAITGSTGFVGKHLGSRLERDGHLIVPLGREYFNGSTDVLAKRLEGCDVVINLAGEPISRRWTGDYKQRMYNSRVQVTRKLVAAMAQLQTKPVTFISTSAIGAFKATGKYTEADTPNADDFLGRLSRDWEEEAMQANDLGVRTLIFRFGLVLGPDGGMMKQLLPPFCLGLGGPVGDGKQAFSWVHIDDLVRAYVHALTSAEMDGVYHLCAPNPDTNAGFTRILGEVVHRPTWFRVPGLALKLAFGEGASVMTSGQRVVSNRLQQAGFDFCYPTLPLALPNIVEQARKSNFVVGLSGVKAGC
mgnify:CR=1 FL=1|jgi:uncharacterized protein